VKLKFFANRETFGWVTDSFFMNCVLVAAVWVGVIAAAIRHQGKTGREEK